MKQLVERTCIVCHQKSDKREFIRIVRQKDGTICLDMSKKKAGRGAYVCSESCLNGLKKSKALSRAFKQNVPDAVYTKILEEYAEYAKTQSGN